MRVMLATKPADFRKGIDGIAQLCRAVLSQDPFSGTVFVFRNRNRTAIKVLVYDGRGFWLCHKRLSKGRLSWWPDNESEATIILESHELAVLLSGGDPNNTAAPPLWRPVVVDRGQKSTSETNK